MSFDEIGPAFWDYPYIPLSETYPDPEPVWGETLKGAFHVDCELQWKQFHAKAVKALAHHSSENIINKFLPKELLKLGLPAGIKRYGKLENLPQQNQELVQNKNCIFYLLLELFSQEGISLNFETTQKWRGFSNKFFRSTKGATAYDKTSTLQTFIHAEVNRLNGKNASDKLNKERMRIVLSTVRLHLSCLEIKVNNLSELTKLTESYTASIKIEKSDSNSKPSSHTGKHIKNWKLRHIKPILWYFPESIRNSLRTLISQERGDGFEPIENLKDRSINELAYNLFTLAR